MTVKALWVHIKMKDTELWVRRGSKAYHEAPLRVLTSGVPVVERRRDGWYISSTTHTEPWIGPIKGVEIAKLLALLRYERKEEG
jgi:hypothetical protein